MKRLTLLPLIFFAMNVFAQTNQINIIGIVPGVSDKTEVDNASMDKDGKIFEIGGYRVMCHAEFEDNDNKLEGFYCYTGKKYSGPFNQVSNTEIHNALVKGFIKKFGEPTSSDEIPVRTGNGVLYHNQIVIWVDKKGNSLALTKMDDTIDEGKIVMKSASFLKKIEKEKRDKKSKAKF